VGVLVGRQAELRQLQVLLARGRPVVVCGEAGVGKTSLVRAAAADVDLELREAGALATLSWLPYLPLRRVLGHEPRGADPAFVARELIESLGGATLLLDDLQWADAQTHETIPFLIGKTPLVATVRTLGVETTALTDALGAAGFELLQLEPLEQGDAAALVRRLRPDLAPALVDRVAARSGGNPLLLEELSASGEPTESLELALAARLRSLAPESRAALGLLAVLGRPLDATTLPDAAALVPTGLINVVDGSIAFRHPLLAEVVAGRLGDDERRLLHARAARLVRHSGEAARHHAAAGESELAHQRALEAADAAERPGELAAHLAVAAACADGAEADELRLRAAALLVEVGNFAEAEGLLDAVTDDDPRVRAEACLLRARAAIGDHDLDRGLALLSEGLSLTAGSGLQVEVDLGVERVSLDLEINDETAAEPVLAEARRLLVLADEAGFDVGAIHAVIGRARRLLGEPDWEADIERALDAARVEGATGIECRTAEAAVGSLFHEGAAPRARRLSRTYVARARELRLASWERRFRTRSAWLAMHGGRYRRAFDEAETLRAEELEWERFLVTYVGAESAIDLGLHDRARELLADLYLLSTTGYERLRQTLWVRADAELWAGRPRESLAAADELLERFPGEVSAFARVTRAWACVELGVAPGAPPIDPPIRLLRGVRPELEALELSSAGDDNAAAIRFREAELAWRSQHERGRLRCAWAEGEALRRAGRADEALERLTRAERLIVAYGHVPLLGRVRRSLRLVGASRPAARGIGARGLTAREEEILTLVGEGLSNGEVARRLGLGRPTVERLVASAVTKLGARSRLQAAALAARR
jgi:DNA-binding CsgD family transcriptional regulator/tetratricopeptide (TPR) repeat protein